MPRCRKSAPLKSVEGPTPRVYAVFRNHSPRLVDVLWLNWKGERVNYTAEGLRPGTQMLMNTYQGHPWIFRDHASGDRLVFSAGNEGRRRNVFFPVPSPPDVEQVVPVNIHLPVYTLRERTLQVVRALTKKADFERLELPRILVSQLANLEDTIETDDNDDSPPD